MEYHKQTQSLTQGTNYTKQADPFHTSVLKRIIRAFYFYQYTK